jgi:hypothetical protein
MHPFRKAVESRDLDAVAALLADDVVFTSPVTFKPYPGKAITAAITVAGKQLQGCDFLHFDDDGKIDEFTVMVRPLSAAQALGEAMGAQFEQIAREAAEQ